MAPSVTTRLETFERSIKLATNDLEPSVVARELAKFAREELAAAIASGEASPQYDRYVNGRRDAPEESVIPPGPIIYVFGYWPMIITAALDELKRRAPVKSGRYAGSFLVLANGVVVRDYAQIDSGAEVIIFNAQPYTRKIETGGNGTGASHFGNAKQALNRRFKGSATIQTLFLTVASGVAPSVPYILRGFRRAASNRGSGRFSRRVRKDRQPGQPLTYPALVINLVQ